MSSRMSGSGREAPPNVWECLQTTPGHPVGPPDHSLTCPGNVLIPYRMFGRTSRVFGRTSRISGSGREALLEVREWSGGPLVCPGVVRRPSWMSRRG